MRALFLAATLALPTAALSHPMPNRLVNLDQPGALEALARDNPAHYRKVIAILELSQAESCETLPGILEVQLDVANATCSAHLFLTSLPPKQHLTFTLDRVSYVTNVVQSRLAPGKLVPAR